MNSCDNYVQKSVGRALFFVLLILCLPGSGDLGAAIKICADGFAVRDMVQEANGRIWIATFGNGLWQYDQGQVKSFACPSGNNPFPMISNLLLDKHRLWIATAGGGCVSLDLRLNELEKLQQHRDFSKLHGLIKTSSGEMLIGSVGSGSAILDKKSTPPAWQPAHRKSFNHLAWVNAYCEWNEQIWLATNTGAYSIPAKEIAGSWQPRSAGLGEGANCFFSDGALLYIGTTSRGVFAMKPGKQPYPVKNTFGEIYFITRFKDKLLAGGQYGLWELPDKTSGKAIEAFPNVCAKSHLVTNNNTLLIGTMDGRIVKTEDLNEFTLLLNLQQHGLEEPNDAN